MQIGNYSLDFHFQPGNTLPGEQLHAWCSLELGQFPLEREQALVSGGSLGSPVCCWRRVIRRRMLIYQRENGTVEERKPHCPVRPTLRGCCVKKALGVFDPGAALGRSGTLALLVVV
jgi:hypothetical protein